MPRPHLRRLVGHQRTRRANRQLGLLLAGVAGAINAGGFLAIQRYTSHMTGIVSGVADDLALGQAGLALAGVLLVAVFIGGAVTTTLLINWARRRRLHSEFALSLLLERPAQLAYDATESLDITRASGAFKFAAQQLGSNRLGAALNSAFYTNASGDIGRKLPPPAALIAGEQNPKPYFSQLWSAVDASAELAVIPAALAESAGDAVAPTNYGMQSPQLSELDHCMTLLMSRGMSRERAAQVCEGPAKSSAAPTELNEAKAVALRTNRPLLVLVSASWCGPCQMFNRQLKTNQSLADEVGRFLDPLAGALEAIFGGIRRARGRAEQ